VRPNPFVAFVMAGAIGKPRDRDTVPTSSMLTLIAV
jgi:hypothetical protein